EREERLTERKVDAGARLPQITVARVRDDANDGDHPLRLYPLQAFTDGIAARPVVARGGLTQHHDWRRTRAIGVREPPPAEHRSAECLEVVRSYDVHIEHRVAASLRWGLSSSRRAPVPRGGA